MGKNIFLQFIGLIFKIIIIRYKQIGEGLLDNAFRLLPKHLQCLPALPQKGLWNHNLYYQLILTIASTIPCSSVNLSFNERPITLNAVASPG